MNIDTTFELRTIKQITQLTIDVMKNGTELYLIHSKNKILLL